MEVMDRDWLIMEKEHDISMRRLMAEYEYMIEDGDSNVEKKKNVIIKAIDKIRAFITTILDKVGKALGKVKMDKIDDNTQIKLDFDPEKELKDKKSKIRDIFSNKKVQTAGKVAVVATVSAATVVSAKKVKGMLKEYKDTISGLQSTCDNLQREINKNAESMITAAKKIDKNTETTNNNNSIIADNIKFEDRKIDYLSEDVTSLNQIVSVLCSQYNKLASVLGHGDYSYSADDVDIRTKEGRNRIDDARFRYGIEALNK